MAIEKDNNPEAVPNILAMQQDRLGGSTRGTNRELGRGGKRGEEGKGGGRWEGLGHVFGNDLPNSNTPNGLSVLVDWFSTIFRVCCAATLQMETHPAIKVPIL